METAGLAMLLPVFLAGLVTGAVLAALAARRARSKRRRREALRLSSLSHDLRTPLSSITAYTEILQDDDEPGSRHRFLEIIHDEAERMLKMIEERLQPGKTSSIAVKPVGHVGPAPPSARGMVLVVDDDRFIAEATQAVLKREGFEALAAGGGEEALLEVRKRRPDLILMDLTMPVMGGDEALRLLRADPQTRGIPVIITTGSSGAPAPEGAAAVLTKPIPRDLLLATVGRVLAGATG